jgi:hypothetical protein
MSHLRGLKKSEVHIRRYLPILSVGLKYSCRPPLPLGMAKGESNQAYQFTCGYAL